MKKFKRGCTVLLWQSLIIMALIGGIMPAYGGEWDPIVPGLVANTMEIKIKNMAFTSTGASPQPMNGHILIIPEGMQVKWINEDPLVTINGEQGLMPHGITILDSKAKALAASPVLTQDHDTFHYTFNEKGTYSYSCFIHPFMTGRIMVVNLPGVNLMVRP